MTQRLFRTTTTGLNRQSPAMRLFEKAKRLGIWNPSDIDFSQDLHDWQQLSTAEQDLILRLTAMFQAGEEAVTLDLLPLIRVIASENRLEEELFLTSFLWEEAKHTDFFDRFLTTVVGVKGDLSHLHGAHYRAIFYEALPQALLALEMESDPVSQVKAAVTYNMIVEGVLAETGYHAYLSALQRNGLMPGQCRGITLVKQDESRHIAYGVFLLSRLLAIDDSLWIMVEQTMNELLLPALGVITEVFEQYDPVPFGLTEEEFLEYAGNQFQKRISRLEKARGSTLEELDLTTQQAITADDA